MTSLYALCARVRGRRPDRGPSGPACAGVACILAAAALAGCSTTGADLPRPVPAAQARESLDLPEEQMARLGYRRTWTGFAFARRGVGINTIEPYEDIVAVLDGAGTMTALEAGSGRMRWHASLGTPLTEFLGVTRTGERSILAVTDTEILFVDVATGSLAQRHRLHALASTSPLPVGGTLVLGTPGGEVFAHLLAAGVPAWRNADEGSFITDPVEIGAFGYVGLVSQAGRVVFLDPVSGTMINRAQIYEGVAAPPAGGDQLMYVASLDQSLYAFGPHSPRPVWRIRTNEPLRAEPVYHGGTVYITMPEIGLSALDGMTGDELWSNPDVRGTVIGSRDGLLLVWDGTDAITVDPQRGQVHDRVRMSGVAVLRTDRFVDGDLFAVSDLGLVARFVPR